MHFVDCRLPANGEQTPCCWALYKELSTHAEQSYVSSTKHYIEKVVANFQITTLNVMPIRQLSFQENENEKECHRLI